MARQKQKPMVLIIVAVMNIIVALPCMCCLGFNAVTLAATAGGPAAGAQPAPGDPFGMVREQTAFMEKESPGYLAEQIGYNVVAVLCSLALLVAAIFLFMGNNFGRILTILASVVMIVAALGNSVYTAVSIMPAMKKWQNKQMQAVGGAGAPKGAFELGGVIGIVIALLFGVGYPALAIGLLMTSPVRQFFSGARRDSLDDDDFDDRRRREDEDDRWREDDRPRPRDVDDRDRDDDDRFRAERDR